jgi:hypothetical protein
MSRWINDSICYFFLYSGGLMQAVHTPESQMNQYTNYLKAALLSQINIVVVAGLALFGLVSWNIIPLLIAATGEALWLLVAPVVPAFRAHVAGREVKFREIDSQAEIRKTLDALPPQQLQRFRAFAALVNAIKEQSATLDDTQKALLTPTVARVDELKVRYVSMLSAEAQLDAYLRDNDVRHLDQKLVALDSEIASAGEQLRAVKAGQREILLQRKTKVHTMEENARLIKAQLESFEDLVRLLKEQSLTLGNPHELAAQVDAVFSQIQITDSVLSDLDATSFEAFDRELEKGKR